MEHPRGDNERGRSDRFDRSRRWETRVIGGDEGMQGSEEGSGSRKRRGGGQRGDDSVDCERKGEGAGEGNSRR